MDFNDVYRKILLNKGSNTINNEIINSKNDVNLTFKEDPSYRDAEIIFKDFTKNQIDIRLINVDRSTEEKKIMFRPDTIINCGEYIKFKDKAGKDIYYIIYEFEENLISPKASCYLCKNILQITKDISFPCYATDSSYGQKGVIDTNFLTYGDGQVMLKVQDNIYTRAIPLGYRLIFHNDYREVFSVSKNDIMTTGNVRRIMIKKVKYMVGYDDLSNNLAYNTKKLELNGFINNDDEDNTDVISNKNKTNKDCNYIIKDDKNKLKDNECILYYSTKNRFYIVDKTNDISKEKWNINTNIDIINKKGNIVGILNKDDNSIEIKCYGASNEDLIIDFVKEDVKLSIKVKLKQ